MCAELVPARQKEGSIYGFLQLSDASGKHIATGELSQSLHGGQVISRLVFRFRDGSIDDERTVFTQNGTFQLVRDHHIQKGPSFHDAVDVDVDMKSQQVTTRSEKDGKPKVETQHMELPPDLANGLPLILVKNILPGTPETKVSYLVLTPKPRLVHIVITPDGEETFSVGAVHYKATAFLFHVELGGILGVVAPLVGKEPPDARAWVLEGHVPAFVRAIVPLANDGPLWTIELASPQWPHKPAPSQ